MKNDSTLKKFKVQGQVSGQRVWKKESWNLQKKLHHWSSGAQFKTFYNKKHHIILGESQKWSLNQFEQWFQRGQYMNEPKGFVKYGHDHLVCNLKKT